MPDWVSEAWMTPGLGWLALAILVAGTVRGFAGFGTGLIFIPLAAIYIPPIWVLVALMAVDLVGTAPLVPRAMREGSMPDISIMLLGCVLFLPFGTMVLQRVDPDTFRWMAAILALGMVALLASGWRHHLVLGRWALFGIGGVSGLLGGVSGMPGPPVILAFMSGQYAPARIRATSLLYLLGFECLLTVTFVVRGLFVPEAFAIGVLLVIPYVAGNLIGARIFDPERATLYRGVAYVIITGSAIFALPLFG